MATTGVVEFFNVLDRRIDRAGIDGVSRRSCRAFTAREHLVVLVFKTVTKSSYRTLNMFVPLVLGREMHFTTPHKAARRFGPRVLTRLLVACLPSVRGRVLSLDSTGFSTDQRSGYYVWRIENGRQRRFIKVSFLVDTRTTAILGVAIHVLPRHELRDARVLIEHARGARHLTADKAYDAEWFHEQLHLLGIQAHIPLRARARKGFWRKKHAKTFQQRIYGRRAIGETTNSVVKRRWGGTMAARKVFMVRTEILLKVIVHNLTICLKRNYLILVSFYGAGRQGHEEKVRCCS